MENFFVLCTVAGVAMDSPLRTFSAGIFMIELERTLILTLPQEMKLWKRYMHYITSIIKISKK